MKKRTYVYICTTFGMLAVVVLANYFSYHAAINEFTKQQQEYERRWQHKWKTKYQSR